MAGMAASRRRISPHVERRGVGDPGQSRVVTGFRGLTTALVLLATLTADLRGQQLLEVDGIELRGNAQLVLSGGGTCNVLESDTSYEDRKQNHGAPMDIWRLDFSVHNGSGRWLDHLIARYQIESEWPECTNWDGPDTGAFSQSVEWANSNGHIQESGRNVVAPGRTLTATHLFIVLRGDPQPRFSNWSMDFDLAAAPPPPGFGSAAAARQAVPAATPEQENIFWQSIVDSTDPADFEAYLEQFPNGVFRSLAQNRLANLSATGSDLPADLNSRRTDPPFRPERPPEPKRFCDFGSHEWDKFTNCWFELASPSDCLVWKGLDEWIEDPKWTGECVDSLANGTGSLIVVRNRSKEELTGTFRNGKKHGRWIERVHVEGRLHSTEEGPYVDGYRQGHWVRRSERIPGAVHGYVEQGPYVDGERHGVWTGRSTSGRVWTDRWVRGTVPR